MLKKGWLFICLGCLMAPAFGQTVIKGTVKDNKSHPIPGASVTIKDSYDGATSDSSGKFNFSTTEKGNHVIIVSAVSYKPFEQTVQLIGETD